MKAKIEFALLFLLYALIITCGYADDFYTVEIVEEMNEMAVYEYKIIEK